MAGFEPLIIVASLTCAVILGACAGRFVCRRTRGARSARTYLVAEVVMALTFALLTWEYGISIQTLSYFVLTSLLLGILLIDLDSMTIPNGFILAGIIAWILSVGFIEPPLVGFGPGSLFVGLAGYNSLAVLIDGFVGAFVVGGGMLLFASLFDKITGKDSLGGGDVKLFFMVGLYLGVATSFFNVMLSCLLGLVFSFIWVRKNKERVFPFGPAIAASTVITLLVGFQFIAGYFSA